MPLENHKISSFSSQWTISVQGLVIKAHNIRYRLEFWLTVEGHWLTGQLPVSVQGHHFDPQLRSYILHQHNHCHVTQPLLLEQLRQWGIDISAGQIDALLSAGKALFHEEKDAILVSALQVSRSITVDDSGARHQGKNGYVLHIGNEPIFRQPDLYRPHLNVCLPKTSYESMLNKGF